MADLPPVSAIADVLALRGLGGWLTPPLRPIVAPAAPLAGRAVTVQLQATPAGRGLAEVQELLSSSLDGAVLVIAGAQSVGGAVWGEILSRAASRAGAVAVLVDGAVRDRPAMAVEALPVFAAGEAVVGPAGRVSVRAIGVPVHIGGFGVRPDDTVVVDATGVVRIPADRADDILGDARAYAEGEDRVLDGLANGHRLVDAYGAKQDAVDRLLGRNSREPRQPNEEGEPRS
jgi:4-hydroxy-4-methyl-2-oxoglutarate aldolase